MKSVKTNLVCIAAMAVACNSPQPSEQTVSSTDMPVEQPDRSANDEPEPFPTEDVSFVVTATAGDHSDGVARDTCWLGGPHRSFAIVQAETTFTLHSSLENCPDPFGYVSGYNDADVKVLRATASSALGFQQSINVKWLSALAEFPETVEPGDFMLVALREASGEWFAFETMEVELRDPKGDETNAQLLPGSWNQLEIELRDVGDDFANTCSSPQVQGKSQNKQMDDATFDQYVHTPNPDNIQCGDSLTGSEPSAAGDGG